MTAQPALALASPPGLPELAERFRLAVTRELATLDPAVRATLRGDYLFHIDGEPRFMVAIEAHAAASGAFRPLENGALAALLAGPEPSDVGTEILRVSEVEPHARATVHTDTVTLGRLLAGTMKAKAAFLAGKVRIEGDLPCFLRLIGLLKARGITAPAG